MDKTQNTSLISKIILLLYLVVGLSPKVVEIEYEGFQWLYFSVLNIISLGFIYSQKDVLKPFNVGKSTKQFFLIFFLFFIASLVSIFQATIVSESLVHIARLFNVIVATFVVFTLVKSNPKDFFEFVCKICVVLLAYHSIVTLEHYLGNYNKPRNRELFKTFLYYYGNVNIFTASLIVKLPFAIYLYFKSNSKIWKMLSGIVVFTTTLSLIFVGSRAALLSMVLIFGITFLTYLLSVSSKENKKLKIGNLTYLILVPLIALFLMMNVNRIDKNKMNSFALATTYSSNDYKKLDRFIAKYPKSDVTTVVVKKDQDDFLTKLIKVTGRYNIWNSAIVIFKENPFLGIGYGNYKIYPHKNYFLKKQSSGGTFGKPIRVHNDFFEKFVEIGIIGGILYLMLFIFILKQLISKFKSENKEIVLFLLLSGLAYTIDAFFNFPLERAPVQLFFVLVSGFALALTNSNKEEKEASSITSILFVPIVLVSIITIFSNYLVFKAYSINTAIKNEKVLKKRGDYEFTFSEMNGLIKEYPTLDQDGIKMKYYLATYAAKEQKYDTALEILTQASSLNVHDFLIKKQKAEIFLKGLKQLDSSEHYFKEVFNSYPSYKFNYTMLKNIYKGKKDTVNFEKLMNKYTSVNKIDAVAWINKTDYFYKKNKDLKAAIETLDTAISYRKTLNLLEAKQKLQKHKNVNSYIKKAETKKLYDEVIAYYNKGKFTEAKTLLLKMLKNNPNDHFAVLYIGIMELSLKNYESSVKYLTESIDKNIFKDGKAEYCRALSYEKLGQKEKAKADYRAARAKKFPQAMSLPESKYK
ncbi:MULTISPECIES: O-antigen ligase family protein [Tenacibaculum]|uniref:O-antigen ligase family protein n=1 Tax=Tenacibaculum TaxID=104267 RepID=UPI001F0A40A0|nr:MULTISPECIES: O-antigen ligase family protein [Tenacibaculum]MCH3882605.1 O-antigen ligase family protein [Tenacibaculum aquimarinum]MDO6600632.1 O-antigen ligase family protein [Tenacibaculum sp. 1_MG-2023]